MIEIDSIWAEFDEYRKTCETPLEQPKKVSHYKCKCGGEKVIVSGGLPVCSSCGLVEEGFIDYSPEWISSVSESGVASQPGRCGMPSDTTLFSESWGAGTVIKAKWGNYNQQRMARINFHTSMNHRDRSLFHAYSDIDRAAVSELSLPETVVRSAKIMYKKMSEEILTRGAVRTGIKANCVFYACKLNNIPRTTKEIADAFGIPTKDLSRTSDIFKESINTNTTSKIKVTRPRDVLPRLLNDFETNGDRHIRVRCLKLASALENCVGLMGKTPNSIAACIIYKVFEISKQDIITKCKISMPTLNKIENIVNKHLEAKSIVV